MSDFDESYDWAQKPEPVATPEETTNTILLSIADELSTALHLDNEVRLLRNVVDRSITRLRALVPEKETASCKDGKCGA